MTPSPDEIRVPFADFEETPLDGIDIDALAVLIDRILADDSGVTVSSAFQSFV